MKILKVNNELFSSLEILTKKKILKKSKQKEKQQQNMKPSRKNSILPPLKIWKPTFLQQDGKNTARNSDFDSKDTKSEISSPRSNTLDSFNLYSALDNHDKLENTASYLPPLNEIARKYTNAPIPTIYKGENTRIDDRPESDLRKFSRLHITDSSLAREKSIIEKSMFFASNQKLDKRKNQFAAKKRYQAVSETNAASDRMQIFEAVRNSLPDIKTVYKNEQGLESRMNSFYYENFKRINKHSIPFCEYAKEHAVHEKDKRKTDKHNCVFCASQNKCKIGALAPENSFIEEIVKPKTPKSPKIPIMKLPLLKFNHGNNLINTHKEYNQAISALNPPERTKKTYFCDVLGEKYCLGCIECHERRFAKVYETKYMNDSDPLLVTMSLLMNQRVSII
jgi:hypothetical protein